MEKGRGLTLLLFLLSQFTIDRFIPASPIEFLLAVDDPHKDSLTWPPFWTLLAALWNCCLTLRDLLPSLKVKKNKKNKDDEIGSAQEQVDYRRLASNPRINLCCQLATRMRILTRSGWGRRYKRQIPLRRFTNPGRFRKILPLGQHQAPNVRPFVYIANKPNLLFNKCSQLLLMDTTSFRFVSSPLFCFY